MTQPSGTKERILDAAETLFSRHGFFGTSMRSIAREAESPRARASVAVFGHDNAAEYFGGVVLFW